MSVAVRPMTPAAFAMAARSAVDGGEPLRLLVGDRVCQLAGRSAHSVLALLDTIAEGRDDDVAALPAELTTGQVADLLGVSRPTVVSLIDKGSLDAIRIGSHRRVRTVDALAYRERARTGRRSALDDIAAISDELGLYDDA